MAIQASDPGGFRRYPNLIHSLPMTFLLQVKKLTEDAILPSYAHPGDAGMDLFSCVDTVIEPGKIALVKTGLSIQLPPNTEAQVRPKSGLALKNHVTVLNTPGTIDEGYRGEVAVILINHGPLPFFIRKGMKIAQMVVKPVIRVEILETEALEDSQRGEGGFGSTGM
uniref:Deoxyuridine 5'-triphosphate nucleotidohydrolase n=1 Tax=Candidatus Kentrum sp. FW TaxID=2126338 RepID=A0A450SMY7_9GAMM|nr:MAG: deoxyuridine 5'-triphosphate nucleotidohydrolase [Candidatus Kentron sp. FW]